MAREGQGSGDLSPFTEYNEQLGVMNTSVSRERAPILSCRLSLEACKRLQ